jgi:NAD(P)-dependent dehydrogenase (short-subunit alcohol dehydrogenase family)
MEERSVTDTGFLVGKVVLITGGARNLGARVAEEFASHGARVAVADVQFTEDAHARTAVLNRGPGRAEEFTADVRSPAEITRLVSAVQGTLGPIEILINNAGPFAMDPFLTLKVEDWDRVMEANLRSVYLLTQQVAPGMNERGWGRIINLSAGSAYLRNHSVYGLAKAAVRFLTEALALEMKPGVTVNAIAPGQIAESAAEMSAFDPTFVERATRITPAGRLVSRAEIAQTMVALCASSWDMVTGLTLALDGGARLPRI